jgi:transcriptional regulator with XRE-family HTH domain
MDLTAAYRRTDTFNRERRSLLGLGAMIRNLRKSRGMTQEMLAERAELSAKYIGEIERGEKNPTFLILVYISTAIGIPVKDLFG